MASINYNLHLTDCLKQVCFSFSLWNKKHGKITTAVNAVLVNEIVHVQNINKQSFFYGKEQTTLLLYEVVPLSIETLDSGVVITDFGDVEGDGIPATSEHNTLDSKIRI